jgi:hypothetical protein
MGTFLGIRGSWRGLYAPKSKLAGNHFSVIGRLHGDCGYIT